MLVNKKNNLYRIHYVFSCRTRFTFKWSLTGKLLVLLFSFIVILFIETQISFCVNCIGGAMVSVLASSAIDRGFKPWSGQTKDYKIGICCFSSKYAALRRKSKDWLARNRNNVLSGATCLPTDCCFSELALLKSNSAVWSRTKWTSSSYHWKLTCSRHDIAEKLLNWH